MAGGWRMGWSGRKDDDGGRLRERHGAPDNEVPATLAVDRILAATDDVVVYVAAMSVYSTGARFTLEVRARPGWRAATDRHVWDSVHGHGRGPDRLLLGVEYADGRRGSNLGGPFAGPGGVSLWPHGSSGGGRSAWAEWFLSPLPPPGEIRLYCAWPAVGIMEAVTTLDAGPILQAAGRVRELWPWEPERREEQRPVRPAVPPGGWFASIADAGGADED